MIICMDIIPLFYVDREKNIPTAFSVLLLQFAAILLLIISVLNWRQSRSSIRYWGALCLGFFFMAADEGWSYHEQIDQPGNFFDAKNFHGLLHFAWIIPFLIILPILLFYFWKFLMGLSFKTRKYFLLAAIIYIGGAIGFESIGGYLVDTIGRNNWWYYLVVTSEEGLEMFGVIVFIYALLDYLQINYKEVRFLFCQSNEKNLLHKISDHK